MEGDWYAALKISDDVEIPFVLIINESKVYWEVRIKNGGESIPLDTKQVKDSLFLKFPAFDSELRLKIKNREVLEGKWYNYAKGDYTIPIYAKYDFEKYFVSNSLENVTGKWAVQFAVGSEEEWPAIGLFMQTNDDELNGTFRTESGDYRFLRGALNNDQFKLSSFDGAHAFLFTSVVKNDGQTMEEGKFYSGKHYETDWVATKNNTIELSNPDSLTVLEEGEKFAFTFPQYDFTKDITYPSETFDNKVVIVQIMGSWCPNCMDESRYLTKLYEEYHDDGLEIIGVAFENPENPEKVTATLTQYIHDLSIPYPILYGGKSSKKVAGLAFPMLDQIMAFPTTIFIDKNGEVRKIHTGFDGPGTDEVYDQYKRNTDRFIQTLLAE